ncbi:MAG TPA: inositol monophosphatase family protein, partial [Candidatus Hydrogenedentes bacterium]|nr:inositol monophosphatase family protein [Candidatus Hydrogenedentota bacterium]
PSDRTNTLSQFSPLIEKTGQIRCHCAAVIGLCSLATADMDAYVHVKLNAYDYAAAMVIVEEAGGRLTRLDGSPIHLFDGRPGVLGSNGILHNAFVDVIAEGHQ